MRLEQRKVALNQLMLDPNNPRLAANLDFSGQVPDSDVVGLQAELQDQFRDGESGSFHDIADLLNSMETIGYVRIDRIVVRELRDERHPGRFVVIEGNRRVSAAKHTLNGKLSEKRQKVRPLAGDVLESLEHLDVLVLPTAGLSAEQVEEQVGVILGVRHFGGVLAWRPLPKAYNIYKEYMSAPPALERFSLQNRRAENVGRRLSIKRADVIRALKTYIAYHQLLDLQPTAVKATHYSLIEEIVTNRTLVGGGYLFQDESTYRLNEASLAKVGVLCQFGERQSLSDRASRGEGVGPILAEPKSVKKLAKLVRARSDGAVGERAKQWVIDVEEGELSLEGAVSELNLAIRAERWTADLRKKLTKQANELPLEDYLPEGKDLENKRALEKAFRFFRLILLDS